MFPSIEEIEVWLGRALPEPYRSFLARTEKNLPAENGITLVYGRDSVIERNETFESQRYCPGNLVIGDDSGGSAFVLSLECGRVFRVGHGTMTEEWFELVSDSFPVWVASGFDPEPQSRSNR